MSNSNTKEEIVFADGFKFRRKHANAPDFVLGSLSIKVDDAISFLKANQKNGWVNLNVNKASSGKLYVELDTFVPKPKNNVENTEVKAEVVSNELDF